MGGIPAEGERQKRGTRDEWMWESRWPYLFLFSGLNPRRNCNSSFNADKINYLVRLHFFVFLRAGDTYRKLSVEDSEDDWDDRSYGPFDLCGIIRLLEFLARLPSVTAYLRSLRD